MPKIKTHKGTAKVFKKRKNDIKIGKPGSRHNTGSKSQSVNRKNRKGSKNIKRTENTKGKIGRCRELKMTSKRGFVVLLLVVAVVAGSSFHWFVCHAVRPIVHRYLVQRY